MEKMLNIAGVSLSQLQVVGYFDSMEALKQSVKEGIGISIISAIAALDYVNCKFINAYELAEAFMSFSLELSSPFLKQYHTNFLTDSNKRGYDNARVPK